MFQVKIELPVVKSRQDLLDYMEWVAHHLTEEKFADYISTPPYSSTLYEPGKSGKFGKLVIAPAEADSSIAGKG
jgi:hypothetical protein